ncbi:Fanconi anemia group D2 protein, partial [Nowakowskiella sp. JEL0078]
KLLSALALRGDLQLSTTDIKILASKSFRYMLKFLANVPNAATAVEFLKLTEAIANVSPEPAALKEQVGWIANQILQKQWRDQRLLKSESLAYLIRKQIVESSDPIKIIEDYITGFNALAKGNAEILETFAFLDNETFLNFYKTVFAQLNQLCSKIPEIIQETEDDDQEVKVLQNLEKLSIVFANLMKVGKYRNFISKKGFLAVFLKRGKDFMDSWNRFAMVQLSKFFRENMEDIKFVLENIQKGTRDLQV